MAAVTLTLTLTLTLQNDASYISIIILSIINND
jgi:hypothetical protein